MKKFILIVLFAIFTSHAFASIKYEATGNYINDFQVFNIKCDSYSEYEEKLEEFLDDESIQIINRFEEERIIQIIYKDYICIED